MTRRRRHRQSLVTVVFNLVVMIAITLFLIGWVLQHHIDDEESAWVKPKPVPDLYLGR